MTPNASRRTTALASIAIAGVLAAILGPIASAFAQPATPTPVPEECEPCVPAVFGSCCVNGCVKHCAPAGLSGSEQRAWKCYIGFENPAEATCDYPGSTLASIGAKPGDCYCGYGGDECYSPQHELGVNRECYCPDGDDWLFDANGTLRPASGACRTGFCDDPLVAADPNKPACPEGTQARCVDSSCVCLDCLNGFKYAHQWECVPIMPKAGKGVFLRR